jgi:hypothetical protein
MSATGCPGCDDRAMRALVEAVSADDLDRALTLGLLDVALPDASHTTCAACAERIAMLVRARDARLRALAARERFRARQARLVARAQARARRREAAAPSTQTSAASSLPPAAAAALARARAKAAAKRRE